MNDFNVYFEYMGNVVDITCTHSRPWNHSPRPELEAYRVTAGGTRFTFLQNFEVKKK
jgi:hypothetical protein